MTHEQFVTAETIALEDARRMAATLHSQAQEEGDERISAAVQLPPVVAAEASTGVGPADSARPTA